MVVGRLEGCLYKLDQTDFNSKLQTYQISHVITTFPITNRLNKENLFHSMLHVESNFELWHVQTKNLPT